MIRKAILILCTLGAMAFAIGWLLGWESRSYLIAGSSTSWVIQATGGSLIIGETDLVSKGDGSKAAGDLPSSSRGRGNVGSIPRPMETTVTIQFRQSDPTIRILLERKSPGLVFTRTASPLRAVRLPLALCAVLLSVYPMAVLVNRPLRRRHRLRHNLCLGCGYPLKGLPSLTCPECGREFEGVEPQRSR